MAPLTPPKRSKEQAKKDLEDKIVELEKKLSNLSSQLGREPNPMVGGFTERSDGVVRITDADIVPIPEFRERLRKLQEQKPEEKKHSLEEYENSYLKRLEEHEKERKNKLVESLDPDGSATRQLLALAEANYQKKLSEKLRNTTRGTMPKGFGIGGEPLSIFNTICSYDKKYAKFLFKSGRCIGCKKQIDKKHMLLCHECANERLNEKQFAIIISKFTRWGLYKKPFLTKIALKLKLAKVVTGEKNGS